MANSWFEVKSGGTQLPLTLLGDIVAIASDGTPTYGVLQLSSDNGSIDDQTPLAAALASLGNTTTTVDLSWTYPPDDGRGPVTSTLVFRDGAQIATVSGSDGTYHDTGRTASTTYNYTVQGVNANGPGELSNQVPVTTGGVNPGGTPLAPTGLSLQSNTAGATDAVIALTWTTPTDPVGTAATDAIGIYQGTTLVVSNIPANATSYSWHVAYGSTHNQVGVARHNSVGWSPVSNRLPNFTAATQQTLAHDPVMGVDYNGGDFPVYYQDWGALRVYQGNNLATVFNWLNTPPRVLCYTENWVQGDSATAVENGERTRLENFYYNNGSPIAAHAACEVHIARQNEEDRKFTSGSLPQWVLDQYAAIKRAVYTTNANGSRRFPLASVWVDMTIGNIRTSGAGPRFKAISQYLDGVACSTYPGGRALNDPTTNNSPRPWFNDYSFYDPLFDTIVDWMTGHPNLTSFASWEIACPIDHAKPQPWVSSTTVTTAGLGEPSASTNLSVRPRYFAGGRTSLTSAQVAASPNTYPAAIFPNPIGVLQHFYNECDSRGIIMREQCYWNRMDRPECPNYFFHDAVTSVQGHPAHSPPGGIDTAKAWHDWVPGSRLPDL